MEVRWAVAGESVVVQLVGRLGQSFSQSGRSNFDFLFAEDSQYVAFGLSGAQGRTRMVGGDVTVAWMEHATGKGYAEDYYLAAKSQCAGGNGACPDDKIEVGWLFSCVFCVELCANCQVSTFQSVGLGKYK